MRWRRRRPIDPPPAMPRLDRERATLARLATATDDAALAEWARLRLRASDFVAANVAPTPAAIRSAATRDAAGESLDLAPPPPPLSHAIGATLVDVTAKLPTLDRLAALNVPRHDAEANARRDEAIARETRAAACLVGGYFVAVKRESVRLTRRAMRRFVFAIATLISLPIAAELFGPRFAQRDKDDITAGAGLLALAAVTFAARVRRRSRAANRAIRNDYDRPMTPKE